MSFRWAYFILWTDISFPRPLNLMECGFRAWCIGFHILHQLFVVINTFWKVDKLRLVLYQWYSNYIVPSSTLAITWLLNLNIQQTLASHADSLCPRQGIFLPHNETATHQEPNSERLETLRDEPLFFFDGEGVGKFLGHEFIFVPPGGALIFSSQTQDLVSRRFLLHSFVLKGPLARFFFSSFKWAGIIFGKLPSPSPLKKMVKPLRGRVSCGLVLEVCFRFNSFLLCWKHATTSSRLEKPRGLRRAEIPTETKSWLTSF